jgi:hypothetical protein
MFSVANVKPYYYIEVSEIPYFMRVNSLFSIIGYYMPLGEKIPPFAGY